MESESRDNCWKARNDVPLVQPTIMPMILYAKTLIMYTLNITVTSRKPYITGNLTVCSKALLIHQEKKLLHSLT